MTKPIPIARSAFKEFRLKRFQLLGFQALRLATANVGFLVQFASDLRLQRVVIFGLFVGQFIVDKSVHFGSRRNCRNIRLKPSRNHVLDVFIANTRDRK